MWLSGAGGDGPRPPGAATGTSSQAGAALFFNTDIATLSASLIVIWHSSAGLQATWRKEHPPHRPNRAKLVHSPLPPTLMELYGMPPFLMSSANDIVGYAALKASTARLHPAGMAVLTVGLLACAAAEPDDRGAVAGAGPFRTSQDPIVNLQQFIVDAQFLLFLTTINFTYKQ